MSTRLLFRATLGLAFLSSSASGQAVRPESVSFMSRLFHMNGIGALQNPHYSHDGRWLAFDAPPYAGRGRNVFVVAASGGAPIAITTGVHKDVGPMWTAKADRIVFTSDRTGGLMTIAIDPATGHPSGTAKRVSVDSVSEQAGFDVAPDGATVAYLTPVGPNRFALRVVPINGGPARTLATVEGLAHDLRFDRSGQNIYFLVLRAEGAPKKGERARDVMRIASAGGALTTVFRIPEGLQGAQIDPVANRVMVRDGDHAQVLSLTGESIAVIPWVDGAANVLSFGFTPDGMSMVVRADASRNSIHIVPLDGGPVRALTDSGGTPWPDAWIGDRIFVSGVDRGARDLLAPDGKKTRISFDLRKANDGVQPVIADDDPFADGVHYLVKALEPTGDTSVYVYDSRSGEARVVARKVTGSRVVFGGGTGDDNTGWVGSEMLYANVRNGTAELHLVGSSGSDKVLLSLPLPKQREFFAVAPGKIAHAYQRGDTAHLDVTIGSGAPVHVVTRAGASIEEIVFKADGSSLYADLTTGKGANAHQRAGFLSAADATSLAGPVRWVDLAEDCWHPTWMPNGDAVLESCANVNSTRTTVIRIPATGAATPQVLTQREPALFWDYTMSPDGKSLAVPAETNSGIDLWRIDLQAAGKARRPGGINP